MNDDAHQRADGKVDRRRAAASPRFSKELAAPDDDAAQNQNDRVGKRQLEVRKVLRQPARGCAGPPHSNRRTGDRRRARPRSRSASSCPTSHWRGVRCCRLEDRGVEMTSVMSALLRAARARARAKARRGDPTSVAIAADSGEPPGLQEEPGETDRHGERDNERRRRVVGHFQDGVGNGVEGRRRQRLLAVIQRQCPCAVRNRGRLREGATPRAGGGSRSSG